MSVFNELTDDDNPFDLKSSYLFINPVTTKNKFLTHYSQEFIKTIINAIKLLKVPTTFLYHIKLWIFTLAAHFFSQKYMQEEINFEIRQFFWFPHSLASGFSVKMQYQYNKALYNSL